MLDKSICCYRTGYWWNIFERDIQNPGSSWFLFSLAAKTTGENPTTQSSNYTRQYGDAQAMGSPDPIGATDNTTFMCLVFEEAIHLITVKPLILCLIHKMLCKYCKNSE